MNKKEENMLLHKVDSMELLIKVLMDELIDNNAVSYQSIIKRLDDIEQQAKEKSKEELGIEYIYYGPKGEA